jgi:hypothetical protein
LFTYLQHVIRAYAGSGIDPDEGLAVYQLSQALKVVKTVDDALIAKPEAPENVDGEKSKG